MTPTPPVPDEGLYTLHFLNVGPTRETFDIQVPALSLNLIAHKIRAHLPSNPQDIGLTWPSQHALGHIYFNGRLEGSFLLDAPKFHDDPNEPT